MMKLCIKLSLNYIGVLKEINPIQKRKENEKGKIVF